MDGFYSGETYTAHTGEVADVAALGCVPARSFRYVVVHSVWFALRRVFLLVWRRKPSVTPLLNLETQSSTVTADNGPWSLHARRLLHKHPLLNHKLQSKHQGHVGQQAQLTHSLLC